MHSVLIVSVCLLALLLPWHYLTTGLTYLATRAEILSPLRVWVVSKAEWTASLLSCDACTSFWTGNVAATVFMLGVACIEPLPWWAWVAGSVLPGICAVGVVGGPRRPENGSGGVHG